MHRCLLISEIVTHILDYSLRIPAESDNPYLEAQNPSVAAAMARTCQALLEPSLDVAWRELHSLKPLLKVLPDEILKAWAGPGPTHENWGEGAEMIEHPITAADWARLDFYSCRIRSLTTWGDHADANKDNGTGKLSDHLFLAITAFHPASRVVLPNLRKLTWEIREPKDLLKMNIFLGPNLRSLSLGIRAFDDEHYDAAQVTAAAAIAQLKLNCPMLEEVDLNGSGPFSEYSSGEEMQEVSQVICALPSVSDLSIGTFLSNRSFYHISKMHSLRKLYAQFDWSVPHPILLVQGSKPFPAMKNLQFDFPDVSWAAQLLEVMDHCDIQKLHLINCPKRDMKHVNDLFRAMNKYCDHAMLNDFSFYLSEDEPDEHDIRDFTIDDIEATAYGNIFEPLSVFRNMIQIQLMFDSNEPVITDTTLEFFAIHFPLLKEFNLSLDVRNQNNVKTTIVGLASFRNCTSLTCLEVPIGSIIVDENNTTVSAICGDNKTLMWKIEMDKIQKVETRALHLGSGQEFMIAEDISPMSVALCLRQIFPSITKINIPQVQDCIDNKGLDMEMAED